MFKRQFDTKSYATFKVVDKRIVIASDKNVEVLNASFNDRHKKKSAFSQCFWSWLIFLLFRVGCVVQNECKNFRRDTAINNKYRRVYFI